MASHMSSDHVHVTRRSDPFAGNCFKTNASLAAKLRLETAGNRKPNCRRCSDIATTRSRPALDDLMRQRTLR